MILSILDPECWVEDTDTELSVTPTVTSVMGEEAAPATDRITIVTTITGRAECTLLFRVLSTEAALGIITSLLMTKIWNICKEIFLDNCAMKPSEWVAKYQTVKCYRGEIWTLNFVGEWKQHSNNAALPLTASFIQMHNDKWFLINHFAPLASMMRKRRKRTIRHNLVEPSKNPLALLRKHLLRPFGKWPPE